MNSLKQCNFRTNPQRRVASLDGGQLLSTVTLQIVLSGLGIYKKALGMFQVVRNR
jgi:hypothetical protein